MDSVEGVGELRRHFEEFTPRLREEVSKGIERFVIGLQAYTRQHYLMGDPLHYRTGNLFRSINYTPVEQTENTISSSVGTKLSYARVHELGGTFVIPAHRRTMSMVFGRPIDPISVMVREHTATYPQRAFLAPALEDKTDEFFQLMDEAAANAVEETFGESGAAA